MIALGCYARLVRVSDHHKQKRSQTKKVNCTVSGSKTKEKATSISNSIVPDVFLSDNQINQEWVNLIDPRKVVHYCTNSGLTNLRANTRKQSVALLVICLHFMTSYFNKRCKNFLPLVCAGSCWRWRNLVHNVKK